MEVFIIKKNRHYSNLLKIKLHILKNKIKYKILFDESSQYDLKNNDQYDINKLFGISYGFHHRNSARFGWRWDLDKGKIEILAYVYKNGKRINEWEQDIHIAYIDFFEFYEMEIQKNKNEYIFTLKKDSDKKVYKKLIKSRAKCFFSYELFPYFGGNKKAPHDISISFK